MTTNDAHAHNTWDDKDGKDAAILQEMIDISNKYSPHNKQSKTKKKPRLIISDDAYASPDAVASSDDENLAKKEKMMDDDSNGTIIAADKDKSFELDNDDGGGGDDGNNVFLRNTTEDPDLNQYWYSEHSIRVLCNAIREGLSRNDDEGKKKKRVAFLSAPSLFFSLPPKEREHCTLFEYDASSWSNCAGFQYYDFNDPTAVPERHRGKYDLIFIDPPFVSTSVWKKYAVTAKLLMNDDDDDDDDDDDGNNNDSRVIAATVDGNAILMKELFDCERVKFLPSIPNLVYQFCIYANFDSEVLAERNGELGG